MIQKTCGKLKKSNNAFVAGVRTEVNTRDEKICSLSIPIDPQ